MDSLLSWVQIHFPILIEYKYFIIFIGATIEGMNTIILTGFLASIGSVLVVPVLLVLLAGEILNGFIWYAVGYFGGSKPIDKWGRKDEKSRKVIETVEHYFHRYSGRAIVLAKLTWSLTIATMIMAGSFKYNLRKFGLYNAIGSIGWIAVVFTISFLFGKSFKALFFIKNFGYLVLFVAITGIFIYSLKHIFRSKFINSLVAIEKLRELGEKLKTSFDNMMSK